MSTATVKLKHGALATVTPDFTITRGITETHSLTLLNADNTALIHASVVTWTFQIAQDFLSRTSILAESTSITFADNVLSGILLNAHTVELKAFMQGKAIQPLYGTLIGLNGSAEVVIAITFRVICANSVYEPDAEPTPAIISGYYTKAQTDALIANIGANLPAATTLARGTIQLATGAEVTAGTNTAKAVVPSTLKTELDKKVTAVDGKALSTNDFTDAYKTKVNADVESVSALPTPAVALLNRSYFLTADDGTSKKGTTWKCIEDTENLGTYIFQQIQTDLNQLTDTTGLFAAKEDTANKATDFSTVNNVKFPTVQAVKNFAQNETLTELTGTEVTVAPWTQSKWSASGVCSLTATGWAESGVQTSEILITLAAGSTPSVIDAAVSDNDVLSAAGVYSCFIRNEDGVVRFKIAGFTEAV